MLPDNPPGLQCPQCKSRIQIQIEQLLGNQPIICANCGLSLGVDREKSKESLNTLRKLEEAQQKAQEDLKESTDPVKSVRKIK